MSWLNSLVPFTVGFCRGFLQECRPQSADQLPAGPSPGGYDFRTHMQQLSAATGYYLGSVDDEGAGFAVPADGRNYTVILLRDGPRIVIRACSQIKFPPGRVPPGIVQVLVNMNAKLPRFSYDLHHGSDSSYFYATGNLLVHELNPASFEAALNELITAVAALDHVLVTEGYAR